MLAGKVAGVQTNPAPLNNGLATARLGLNNQAAQVSYMRPGGLNNAELKGIVKDDAGEPLPGASVRIKGTSIVTQTNSIGYFKLDSVPNNSTLSVDFIGYNKKEISVIKHDSLVIAMQPNQNALAEVVTTAYGTQHQEYQSAHPQNGWTEFKKYLKDNAKSPDGKTGKVRLSFMVNSDNSLSDFKIIKSVSAKTDSAAIDLVNNGARWQRNTNNKPEKVKLSIKFTVQ
jgi:hypothetical protein